MTEEAKLERQTLEGLDALDLWRQGREAWNRWIDQHPGRNINFAGIDFANERASNGMLSFEGYNFGDGDVFFFKAKFGNDDVDFYKTTFGNGNVDFSEATFGNGNVDFSEATFGNGILDFSRTTFGDGNVRFSNVKFGDGYKTFYDATFGTGEVNFLDADFGNGNVDFFGANFGNGILLLSQIVLGKGNLVFANSSATTLIFSPKDNKLEAIEARGLLVKRWSTIELSRTKTLKSVDMQGASFEGPLFVSGDLNIIPDLRTVRSSHQVELSDLKVKLPRISPKIGWPPKLSSVAKDPQDSARLRRLKEIAETNKDHQAALRFSADENRAKRWIETSWFGSVLDMAFSAFSDYGQNILRPFVALIVLTVTSMGLYKTLATASFANWWASWAQGAVLSASNSLPFLPQSRDLRTDALTALYGTAPGLWVDAIMITQGVLSFVFLFLIGLGLRNRFRL